MLDRLDRQLVCYRLDSLVPYDEEIVWAWVQSLGGHLSIRGDCIDYYVPADRISFFLLKYPDLSRQLHLDYL